MNKHQKEHDERVTLTREIVQLLIDKGGDPRLSRSEYQWLARLASSAVLMSTKADAGLIVARIMNDRQDQYAEPWKMTDEDELITPNARFWYLALKGFVRLTVKPFKPVTVQHKQNDVQMRFAVFRFSGCWRLRADWWTMFAKVDRVVEYGSTSETALHELEASMIGQQHPIKRTIAFSPPMPYWKVTPGTEYRKEHYFATMTEH